MSGKNIYKTVLPEPDAVLDAIERRFGFVVDKIVRQQGFCDLTYHVVQAGKTRNEFIFKVFVDQYTSNVDQIKAEIKLMHFLAENGVLVPRLVQNKEQHLYCKIDMSCGGKPTYTRMQTYLKGTLLRDVALTPELCTKFGLLAGRIDSCLEKFSSPFYDAMIKPDFLINYRENARLANLLPYLKNDRTRKLVSSGFQLFEHKIEPNFSFLPIQQIHGDLDCGNVVVTSQIESDGLPALGVIDFADSRKTCRVYEPAASIAGILAFGGENATVCAKNFLSSYRSVVKMAALELDLLRACVISRLANIITFHEFNALTDPNYDGYMLKACGNNIYDLLERLLAEEQSDSPAFLQ